MLKELQLPAIPEGGFELRFEESASTFAGIPEYMTMDFVRKYYPWTGGDEKHYAAFEYIVKVVSENKMLQLYAHHASLSLFVYPFCEANYAKWPTLDAALGKEYCGMFDFMIAMSAIPMWCKTHEKLGIPATYSKASALWLNGTLQIYNSAHPGCYGIDRGQAYWLAWNIMGKLFRIGRFEYMAEEFDASWMPAVFRNKKSGHTIALCADNWGLNSDGSRMFPVDEEEKAPIHTRLKITEDSVSGTYISPTGFAMPDDIRTLSLNEYEPVFLPGDLVVGMHIPGGGQMTLDLAYESWNEALKFFPEYLKRNVKGICCRSWIFNSGFERELPESNLAILMKNVYLFPERSFGRDGAFFIFGRTDGDFASYPCDNSIRRAFHRIVNAGELLKCGGMFILPQEIETHNCKKYRMEG